MEHLYENPEPVPAASQLAVLPLVAAVEGFLKEEGTPDRLRLTVHRTMSRERNGYLQQTCAYLPNEDPNWRKKVGRLFPVTEGIMGAAFKDGLIWRTKSYTEKESLLADLKISMRETGDERKPEDVALSYLAVPLLGPSSQVVLILYAECYTFNFFADDDRIRRIVAMCRGLCDLFDWLQKEPFSNLRNFPLQKGELITEPPTVYSKIQESVASISPPKFKEVTSFNYEASVA